jgi:Xaa-Pro aminopeptidase
MSREEQSEKHSRVRNLLDEKSLEAIVLRKGANIAWFLGGRAHVPTTLELACLDLIIYRDRIVVVTNKIEAPRLRDEELSGAEELIVVNWFEGRDAQLPHGERIGTDGVDPTRRNLLSEIERLRRQLNEYEISRLKQIGVDASAALEDAMLDIESDMSEVEVAGEIAEELWERDLEPVVLLVAGSNRIEKYRHPLPTRELIGQMAMGVICARRKGLIVSVTRLTHFGELSSKTEENYQRLLNVEAAFLDATKPGSSYSDAFKAGATEYLRQGFDRDEWTRHHQGGPTGYLPRDFTANERSDEVIGVGTAIAWNPSAVGLKLEDTIITTDGGHQFISSPDRWPTLEVAGRRRPAIALR